MTKLIGKQELNEIKKELDWEGTKDERTIRLVNTIEVLSKAMADAQGGKSKLLSERDLARKSLIKILEVIVLCKEIDFFDAKHHLYPALDEITKNLSSYNLPHELLLKLSKI